MNYEIDKVENDLKNMYIVFNPKKRENIKIIDDIIIHATNLNELFKNLCALNNIN